MHHHNENGPEYNRTHNSITEVSSNLIVHPRSVLEHGEHVITRVLYELQASADNVREK